MPTDRSDAVNEDGSGRPLVDLLVAGGQVLTMDVDQPELDDGAVAVDAGRIVAVGARAEIDARFRARETLDARGCAVRPGLIDAYAHAGHGLIRGLMHPETGWPASLYWTATTPAWWRAEADLAALERLRAGVTTGLSVIGATPARADRTEFADANAEAYLAAGLSVIVAIGPPDPIFPHLEVPFTATHLVGDALVPHRFTEADATATSLADDEVRVLGAHRCGIGVVTFTHENLWYGVAPLPALIAAGCAVAVTTDGAAPYTSLDLWRALARTAWNQWQAAGTQAVMPPQTLLRLVTIDAARALGLDERVGSLTVGKDADLVVLDLRAAHLGPIADLHDVVAKGAVCCCATACRPEWIPKRSWPWPVTRRQRPETGSISAPMAAAPSAGVGAVWPRSS